nr:hypothetical protein [Tanacetum cinerariifolium]
CCDWNGVTCDLSTGDVIGIDVSCGMLQVIIHANASLFNLPRLQKLNLAYNFFAGSQLPYEIGSLNISSSLKFLNLSNTGLQGKVPHYIFNLPSLEKLDLSYNSFTGDIPLEISLLPKLVFLDLSSNGIDNLRILPLVFENLLRNSTLLRDILLYQVNIGSVLPTYINVSSLKSLDLRRTNLQGNLPDNIFNLRYLELLDLSENNLTGPLPSRLFTLPYVQAIRLNDCCDWNGVTCHLSTGDVIGIDVSCGMLQGKVPHYIFNLPSLEKLDLSYNSFTGDIPLEISLLPKLVFLDLSSNGIDNLQLLDLSENNLTGPLPSRLFTLPYVQAIRLNGNKFSGDVPFHLFDLPSLKWLILSRNQLAGHVDVHIFGKLPHLTYLDLSLNNFSGLPQIQWYRLQGLFLQSNLIEGPFPPSICNMSSLLYLDMSNNSFGGLIPECAGNINSLLVMMNLANNQFQGTIPNVLEDCRYLEGLILNGNQLEGEVPSSFSKCQSLRVVDLGNNQLNGTFPQWLGELPNLQVLDLKSNKLRGIIRMSSSVKFSFPSLRVLDVSHNGFFGQLPIRYFQYSNALKNMVKSNTKPEYLQLGSSYYSFVIAVKGVDQHFAQLSVEYTILDLSENNFEREIPDIIGKLNSLKVLNLSHNSLNGRIPDSLGRIPEGTQFNTFDESSFEGNMGLCGFPLPKKCSEQLHASKFAVAASCRVGIQFFPFLPPLDGYIWRIPEGTQFNTFDESSFEGNMGLCGFLLPKKCSERTHKPQLEEHENHEEKNGFTWEVVTLGYGCGALLGLVTGYLMLSTRKVKWFNAIADAGEHIILQQNKRKYVFIER